MKPFWLDWAPAFCRWPPNGTSGALSPFTGLNSRHGLGPHPRAPEPPSPEPIQHAARSYPGEVSRVREVRALEKCLMSHSFTSCSRICGEGAERYSEGPSVSPRSPPGTLCPRTQPGTGVLAPEQSLEGSMWGGIMPGEFEFSCPAPLRTLR